MKLIVKFIFVTMFVVLSATFHYPFCVGKNLLAELVISIKQMERVLLHFIMQLETGTHIKLSA